MKKGNWMETTERMQNLLSSFLFPDNRCFRLVPSLDSQKLFGCLYFLLHLHNFLVITHFLPHIQGYADIQIQ